MGYLCVNRDGQEMICQNEPTRWGYIRIETTSPWGTLDKKSGKRYEIREAHSYELRLLKPEELSYWEDMEMIEMGTPVYYTINLPKGSIYKLIGRELSWEDDPIEI